MTEITMLLDQFASRYRARLLVKVAVLAVLGLGVLGTLSWKLQAVGFAPLWSFGVPGCLAVVWVAGLFVWLRRHWFSHRQSAVFLDHTLGLEERLITATEFAELEQPPPLYPLLVEDTERRFSTGQVRFPRPVDHTSGLLVVALLLLLLWPSPSHAPLPLVQPKSTSVPQEQPPERQSQSQPQPSAASSQGASTGQQERSSQSSEGGASSTSQSGGSQEPNRGAEGSGRSQETREGDSSQGAGGADRMSHQAQGSAGRSQQTPSGQGQHNNQPAHMAGSDSSEHLQGGEEAGAHQKQQREQAGHSPHQQQAQRASGGQGDQGGGSQQTARSRPEGSGQSVDQRSGGRDATLASEAASQQEAARQGAGSSGQQEALKADIQQLLKELSGELKNLQSQLVAAKVKAPEAGTGTDPELYGTPMAPEHTAGEPVSIQLQTDAKETKTQRPGGGVGRASGEVSEAHPQMTQEAAQLSKTPSEEAAMSRQPIPPAYRNIFERLQTPSPTDERK